MEVYFEKESSVSQDLGTLQEKTTKTKVKPHDDFFFTILGKEETERQP